MALLVGQPVDPQACAFAARDLVLDPTWNRAHTGLQRLARDARQLNQATTSSYSDKQLRRLVRRIRRRGGEIGDSAAG